MLTRWMALIVALSALLVLNTAAQPFAGFPVLTCIISPQAPTVLTETVGVAELKAKFATALISRYPAVFGAISAEDDIYFFGSQFGTPSSIINVALNPTKYHNGIQLFHFDLAAALLQSGEFLAQDEYTFSNAVVAENAAPSVAVSFLPFGTMYAGSGATPLQTVQLAFSPRRGRTVEIQIASANGVAVTTTPATLLITFPAIATAFQVSSSTAGLANFTATVVGGTDGALRYIVDTASLATNVAQFLPSGQTLLLVTPPGTKTYASTISDNFTIQVPASYLYDTFAVNVALRGSPLGLTFRPPVLVLTRKQPAAGYTFTVSGPVGSYTLGYTLTGLNGADFGAQPRTPCFVDPTLNVTVSRLADAYMITPYYSTDYGGAFSDTITVRIRRPPKYHLVFAVDADDSYTIPARIEFTPNSSTEATFILVAKSTGIKIVTFLLSGVSAGDYGTPPARTWEVRTPNMHCASRGALHQTDCLSLNGCRWNAALGQCSNRTLPIHISAIPIVFNLEPKALEILLPTPVVTNLTIVLTAKARLAFSPKRLFIGPGQQNASFGFIPKLKRFDGTVQQDYFLKLYGPDANVFTQQLSYVVIRPQIRCNVTGPWSFYVVTGSTNFTVTCDTPADSRTTMELYLNETGTASPFSFSPAVLEFLPGATSANFSVPRSSAVGLYHAKYRIVGVDTPRYAAVPLTPIKALGSIRVCLPPSFGVTGGILSTPYNLDLSEVPTKVVTVFLTVIRNASTGAVVPPSAVSIIPTNITFNNTQRGSFQVIGLVPGDYLLNVSLEGDLLTKYDIPSPLPFTIQDPQDGNAFTARLGALLRPEACQDDRVPKLH